MILQTKNLIISAGTSSKIVKIKQDSEIIWNVPKNADFKDQKYY